MTSVNTHAFLLPDLVEHGGDLEFPVFLHGVERVVRRRHKGRGPDHEQAVENFGKQRTIEGLW